MYFGSMFEGNTSGCAHCDKVNTFCLQGEVCMMSLESDQIQKVETKILPSNLGFSPWNTKRAKQPHVREGKTSVK